MGGEAKVVRTDSELEAALQATEGERERLANALGFEQAKNQILLDEVVALEDEVVNRCLEDYEAVLSDETREFWREQLLSNRQGASAALAELTRAKPAGSEQRSVGGTASAPPVAGNAQGQAGGKRPLHNRAGSRPVAPVAVGGGGTPSGAEDRAAKIRNRAQELCSAERIPFSTAFRRAEREISGQ